MINRFDASKFPTRFGGQIRGFKANGCIDAKNDWRRDDCLRYCIVAGKKALEDADLAADKRSKGLIELDPVEVKMEYINFKKFDFVEGYSNHPYLKSKSSWWQPPKNLAKKISEEWRILAREDDVVVWPNSSSGAT